MNTDRSRSGRSSRSPVGPLKRTSPFSMNTARSARVRATLTDCSTITIVVPAAWMVRSTSRRWPTTVGARPRDSSSTRSSRGFVMNDWARASICCSPPERYPAGWAWRSARIGNRSRTSARADSMRALSFRNVQAARRRCSSTVTVGKIPLPPGMSETPARVTASASAPVMSRPSRVIRPAAGSMSPEMALSSVDLPAPLVPRRATISPSSTSKSTPKRTWTGP